MLWASLALCALAIVFIVAPWWLRDRTQQDRSGAAVAIVRARLAELERDYRSGSLDEADYLQLKLEQERRLLEDTAAAPAAAPLRRGRGPLLLAAVLVPLFAVGFYYHFGGWADANIQRLLDRSERQIAAGEDNRATLEELTKALEQRLQLRDDDDGRRRFMLARIHTEFGRYDAAVIQYRLLQQQFPEDPAVAGQYAQALYLAAGRKFTDEAMRQAQRAIAGDPEQVTALGLLGMGAFERRDFAAAVQHWRQLLRLLPAGAANTKMIEHGIQSAEQQLAEQGGSVPAPEQPAAAPVGGPSLVVAVSIDPELAAARPAGATLFVFARAVGGSPMPLAVVRMDAAKLPLQVTLDDSMAMAPGMNLSSMKQVEVVARITASGQVRAGPGDFEGSSGPVTLTGEPQQLTLRIDRRL